MTTEHVPLANNHIALLDFMLASADRYNQLIAWHHIGLPFFKNPNFEENIRKLVQDDVMVINSAMRELGKISVNYPDPLNGVVIEGVFTGCAGFIHSVESNKPAVWVMQLQTGRRPDTTVPIRPDQLHGAANLV